MFKNDWDGVVEQVWKCSRPDGRHRWMGVLLFHSVVSSRLLWLLDRMSIHKYWCVLVSGQIYLDHCFEFGYMGQLDVVAKKYSGCCILYIKTSWCCNRRVSNVCQPSLLCMCVTLVVRRWSCTTNRAALLCIFSRVSILYWVCGFQAIAPYSNFGLTSML